MTEKILYLLRHAEAENALPTQDDHERNLTARGESHAKALSNHMKSHNILADSVLCSTATRTRQTLQPLLEAGIITAQPEYTQKLYHASATTSLRLIQRTPDHIKTLLLVGHNPGMHQLSARFSTQGNDALLEESTLHYPPCTLSCFSIPISSWAEIAPDYSTLQAFLTPAAVERMQLSGVA